MTHDKFKGPAFGGEFDSCMVISLNRMPGQVGKSILAFKVKTVIDQGKRDLVDWEPSAALDQDEHADLEGGLDAWLATNPLTLRILCISTKGRLPDGSVQDKLFECMHNLSDGGEMRMLHNFMEYSKQFTDYTGWASKSFDVPLIRTRCHLLGVPPFFSINTKPFDLYPRSDHADLLVELYGGRPKRQCNLRNATLALKAPPECVPDRVKVQELLNGRDAEGIRRTTQQAANGIAWLFDRFYGPLHGGPWFFPATPLRDSQATEEPSLVG